MTAPGIEQPLRPVDVVFNKQSPFGFQEFYKTTHRIYGDGGWGGSVGCDIGRAIVLSLVLGLSRVSSPHSSQLKRDYEYARTLDNPHLKSPN